MNPLFNPTTKERRTLESLKKDPNFDWFFKDHEFGPSTFEILGFYPVFSAPQPRTPDLWEKIVELEPTPMSDSFMQVFDVVPVFSSPEGEQAWVEQQRAWCVDKAAELRYIAETSGVNVGPTFIKTDRESQSTVGSAKLHLSAKPPGHVVEWKGANGWVDVDLPTITIIAEAVGDHVQRCFSRERQLSTQADAATTPAEISALVRALSAPNAVQALFLTPEEPTPEEPTPEEPTPEEPTPEEPTPEEPTPEEPTPEEPA